MTDKRIDEFWDFLDDLEADMVERSTCIISALITFILGMLIGMIIGSYF